MCVSACSCWSPCCPSFLPEDPHQASILPPPDLLHMPLAPQSQQVLSALKGLLALLGKVPHSPCQDPCHCCHFSHILLSLHHPVPWRLPQTQPSGLPRSLPPAPCPGLYSSALPCLPPPRGPAACPSWPCPVNKDSSPTNPVLSWWGTLRSPRVTSVQDVPSRTGAATQGLKVLGKASWVSGPLHLGMAPPPPAGPHLPLCRHLEDRIQLLARLDTLPGPVPFHLGSSHSPASFFPKTMQSPCQPQGLALAVPSAQGPFPRPCVASSSPDVPGEALPGPSF